MNRNEEKMYSCFSPYLVLKLSVIVEHLDHIYHLLFDPVVAQYFSHVFSVKAFKGIFKVTKGNVDRTVPFRALFHNLQ